MIQAQKFGLACASYWHRDGEDAMKLDLLIISGGILAVGAVIWGFWGNPDNTPRAHSAEALNADPQLKLVSQRSMYMRDER
jgi:hypothetical protein